MGQTGTVEHAEGLSRHRYSCHGRLRWLSRRSGSWVCVFTICLLGGHGFRVNDDDDNDTEKWRGRLPTRGKSV